VQSSLKEIKNKEYRLRVLTDLGQAIIGK